MSSPPASGRDELEARLRSFAGRADAEMDIAEAALTLAAFDRPGVSLRHYRQHLSRLARDTADLGERHGAAASLHGRIEALNAVMLERYGYAGDRLTYDDIQNANLMRVIDRRKGLPVALGILYMHAARAQGWPIEGLNFPGHFLLRLELGGERAILDPFNGGALRGPHELRELLGSVAGAGSELTPAHTTAVSDRGVLLRLQNNIKLRQLQERRPEAALGVLETMLMFAPDHGELWHETGGLHARLGNLRAAAVALENSLELVRDGPGRRQAAALLRKVKMRLN